MSIALLTTVNSCQSVSDVVRFQLFLLKLQNNYLEIFADPGVNHERSYVK